MNLNKRKKAQLDQFLTDIFNIQDGDMLVVRRKDCSILFANDSANRRMRSIGASQTGCKLGYSRAFSGLCRHCPATDEVLEKPVSFELEDGEGRFFSATAATLDWLDEKPATAFFVRDVTEYRSTEKKLYSMAYVDQLSGVPNRQKFREDFEKLEADILAEKRVGIVCIFDLDNFKSINDTYGHNTGDVMLRRLTEHLQADPAFQGHLYRLGGDEFVLLYSEEAGRFADDEECRSYYDNLLEGAFVSYTMPNIELSCTISMGIAFFPKHGDKASDLLRKADIALYKAKAEGRNRKIIFEDRYDTAKKFKDLYINIQPILNGAGQTFGYELLDRGQDNATDEQAVNLNGFDRTIDALGLGEMENNARYFIGYSSQLTSPAVVKNLPRDKFIVQIVLPPRVEEREKQKYKDLRASGYSLAFSGLQPSNMLPEVLALADYFKIAPGTSDASLRRLTAEYPQKTLIATAIDTQARFDGARRAGFKLFQGFFFNEVKPVVKKTKEIDPLKVNYFRLLQLTSTDDYVDFKEISSIISSDVALSYKLLTLLNSAAVGLRNVSSIAMALAYLGEDNLKKWIALLALRGIADDKPLELVRMSLIRARFGELLAPSFRIRRDSKHVFLLGMLSLLHIALEKSKEELLEEIPVADDIRESLLSKTGVHSDLLAFFSSYEYANWDEVTKYAEDNYLDPQRINDCYIEAVKWANDLVSAQS